MIPNGATLNINNGAEIGFGPAGTIIVEAGGTLNITDGAHLTNLVTDCGTSALWAGIKLLGDASMSQAFSNGVPIHQGFVSISGNSEISGAVCGIYAGDPDDVSKSGGVVHIIGTEANPPGVIRNCHTGIYFREYEYQPNSNSTLIATNQSRFTHAEFIWDDQAIDAANGFNAHMVLERVKNIFIRASKFENAIAGVSDSHLLGHGIVSLGGSFIIDRACPGPSSGCALADMIPTRFIRLDHGLHVMGPTTNNFMVRNSSFEDNICGVFMSGVSGGTVMSNEFEMGGRSIALEGNEDDFFEDRHRAVYAYESNGFRIEKNTVSLSSGALSGSDGVIIGYSGTHDDAVRLNTATDMQNGFVGEGICAGGTGNNVGLQFICNTNINNAFNFSSRKTGDDIDEQELHTIRTKQGTYKGGVNNSFDLWPLVPQGQVQVQWDFHKNTDHAISYFYGLNTNMPDVVPVSYPGTFTPIQSNWAGSACERVYNTPSPPAAASMILQHLNEARNEYGNTRYLYEQLIDGGNTDEVVQEIISTWPQDALELRDYLLAKSPYLSVTSLRELIQKQGIPDAIKAEICIANPEATQTDRFVDWLREIYFPQYLIDNIRASWDTRTYRFTLESEMAHDHFRMSEAAHDLLDIYSTDSLGIKSDSVLYIWQRTRTPNARYAEALVHMEHDRYDSAYAVIERLPQEHDLRSRELDERGRMLAWITMMEDLHRDDRHFSQLDDAEIAAAEALIAGQRDKPSVLLGNLLCFYYKRCTPPVTGGSGGDPKNYPQTNAQEEPTKANSLKISPNPANNWVAFDCDLSKAPGEYKLVARDISGRVVWQQLITPEQGQMVWDIRNTSAGSYTISVELNGIPHLTEKLVVQP